MQAQRLFADRSSQAVIVIEVSLNGISLMMGMLL
jgi:hypothetical protein